MLKFAVLVLLVGAVAASGLSDVSSQRAVIRHVSPYKYGDGISSRYFDKVENRGIGLGLYGGLGYGGLGYGGPVYGGQYLGGLALDGIDNLGLAYTGRDLADGRLGLGLGYGRLGLGYGRLGLGYGRLGYGYGGLGYLA